MVFFFLPFWFYSSLIEMDRKTGSRRRRSRGMGIMEGMRITQHLGKLEILKYFPSIKQLMSFNDYSIEDVTEQFRVAGELASGTFQGC